MSDHIEVIEIDTEGFRNVRAVPTDEQITSVEFAFRRVAAMFEDSRRQIESWIAESQTEEP